MFTISYLARPPKHSRVPRFFALGFAILLLWAGLFPFTGWRDNGTPLWAFLSYHWPYYFSRFDFGLNIVAFIPLGIACRQDFRQRHHAVAAWIISAGLCALLSFTIESVQMFLPGRNASNVDLLANSLGGMLGALIPPVFRRLPFSLEIRRWRYHVFAEGLLADYALVLGVIWFIAQSDPAMPMFGIVVKPQGLPQPFESPISDPGLFLRILEVSGSLVHFLCVSIFVAMLVRSNRYFYPILLTLSLLTLLMKLALAGLLLTPGYLFSWLNLNIALAQCLGWLILPLLIRFKRVYLALGGLVLILLEQVISYHWPLTANPVAMLHIFKWSLGHLQNFTAVANLAADLWPCLVVFYFLAFLLFKYQKRSKYTF